MQVERGYLDSGAAALADRLDQGVVIIGPAGAGRSTLLADVADLEGRRGRRVLWCRGCRHGAPEGEAGEALAAPTALVDLLRQEPSTLLVDDAHLLPDDLAVGLAHAAERRRTLGLRLAVARRPGVVGAALAALEASVVGAQGAVHLGPLRSDDVVAWAAAIRGATDADVAARLAERTGGWPELVAAELLGGERAVGDLVGARLGLLARPQRRAVTALAFGLAPGTPWLRAAAELDDAEVEAALDAALREGLLHGPLPLVPAVAAAVRSHAGPAARAAVARAALSAPADVLATVAGYLAELDDRSAEAAELFARAGHAVRVSRPAVAADLLARAASAGYPAHELALARAEAALSAGRPDEALALAREAAASQEGAARDRALLVAAAAWAHLGRPELVAACLQSAAGGSAAHLAELAAAANPRPTTDDGTDASSPAAAADDALAAAFEPALAVAQAARAFRAGDGRRAVAALERAAVMVEAAGEVEVWPDSPHAAGALLAAHELDVATAQRLARAACERAVGGDAHAPRHQLLAAWAALRAGSAEEAEQLVAGVEPVTPRDRLLHAAVSAAVALRAAGPADLAAAQKQAHEALAQADLDLLAADLAVELAQLAARAGADPAPVLAPVERMAGAGGPPMLTVAAAWGRCLLAALADDAGAAEEAAAALRRMTDASDAARVLAPAAQAFAHVLAGQVDEGEVRQATDLLARHGLGFEASRLAGAAGLRCADPSVARVLLAESRRLRGTRRTATARGDVAVAALSAREREVAEALLEGKSHREIGEALYISAKTVEHHVARIRQKVGAGTRAELLAALRAQLATSPR